jgi:hypothetical protein
MVLHRSQSGIDQRVLWVCCDFIFLLLVSVATLCTRNTAADNVSAYSSQSVGGCPSIRSGQDILSRMTFGFGGRYKLVPDSMEQNLYFLSISASANGDGGLTQTQPRLQLKPVHNDEDMLAMLCQGIVYYRFKPIRGL